MFMRFMLALLLMVPLPALAQEPPQTIELPTTVIQEIVQFLSFDRGRAAAFLMREIDDCVKNQNPTVARSNQADMCPAITAALKARADAQAAAVDAATHAKKD